MTVEICGSVSKSWLARHLGVQFDHRYYFDPACRAQIDRECNEYVREKFGTLAIFYTESNLGQLAYYSDGQVLVGGIQPNLILGMLLGAEFIPSSTADADIRLPDPDQWNFETLPLPEALINGQLVRMFDRQMETVREQGRAWRAIPPFFWDVSGRAAIHGAMTSAFKLKGDSFLMDMVDAPDRACELVEWINRALLHLVEHFSREGQLPVTGVHYGECAACMIDERAFRRFVLPMTSAWGQRYGGLRFHSCGCIDHLLGAVNEIQGLHSVDVGGNTSVARIRLVLGRDIAVGIAPLVSQLQAAEPEPLLEWAETVISQNDDAPLTIGYHLEDGYQVENILRLHEMINGA